MPPPPTELQMKKFNKPRLQNLYLSALGEPPLERFTKKDLIAAIMDCRNLPPEKDSQFITDSEKENYIAAPAPAEAHLAGLALWHNMGAVAWIGRTCPEHILSLCGGATPAGESNVDAVILYDAMSRRLPSEMDSILMRAKACLKPHGRIFVIENIMQPGRVGVYMGQLAWAGFLNAKFHDQVDVYGIMSAFSPASK